MSFQATTTEKFEFQSEIEDTLNSRIRFSLNAYATVTDMQIMFPVGDSYNFEIHLFYYNGDGEADLLVTVGGF